MSRQTPQTGVRQVVVPGRGAVGVELSVRLVAAATEGDRESAVELACRPRQEVAFAEGIGRGQVWMDERSEDDGALAFRLRIRADLAAGWVLREAALRFAVAPAGWQIVLPSGWGRELPRVPADLDFTGNYPGWSALAQLVVLQASEGGLSVSARDARLELKWIRARRAATLGRGGDRLLIEFARAAEQVGGVWQVDGDCDVVVAPHAGDWVSAARDYRRRQEAVRPALKSPGPPHPRLEGDPVWLTQNCFVFPPHSAEETAAAARQLGGPVLCHLYNWQDAPFDTRYPEWVGLRAETPRQVATLTAAGIGVVPYVNARLWDRGLDSWASHGRPSAVRDRRGEAIVETYPTTSASLAVMCPDADPYQDRVIDVCRRLAESGLGFAGIYLDQLGAAFGVPCYAAGHGHPPGGAASWNAGQRRLVGRIRAALAAAAGPAPILTTENASEPLVDLIDGFLYYCGVRDEPLGRPVPLWQAIYGDFGRTFAEYFDQDLAPVAGGPSPGLMLRLARQAVFGSGMGWLSPRLVTGPFAAAGALIRNARRARRPMLPFFRQGRLCVAGLDTTGQAGGAVQAAWRLGDETVCLAVNPDRSETAFTWPDGKKATLGPCSADRRRLD